MFPGPGRGIDQQAFRIDGVEFVSGWQRPSQSGSMTLRKAPRLVDAYRRLFAPYDSPNVVELGIAEGGSVALLALLARPRRMVALELSDAPVEALAATLAAEGLADAVHPHYGVDQGDDARVRAIVEDAFGDEPLDVVVDDASHVYELTLASFEVLFPRLRPGGAFVIEDWNCNDSFARAWTPSADDLDQDQLDRIAGIMSGEIARPRPLSRLVLELVMAQAQSPGAVASLAIDEDWAVVHRGEAPLDRDTFRLGDLYSDHFRTFTGSGT